MERIKQKKRFLEMGEWDHTTVANVSVMVYFTPSFTRYVSSPESKRFTLNLWSDPVLHIKRSIAYTNLILEENEIPVQLKLHCIEELAGFVENPDEKKRLKEFLRAKETTRALLNHADMAVLMVGTPCSGAQFNRKIEISIDFSIQFC